MAKRFEPAQFANILHDGLQVRLATETSPEKLSFAGVVLVFGTHVRRFGKVPGGVVNSPSPGVTETYERLDPTIDLDPDDEYVQLSQGDLGQHLVWACERASEAVEDLRLLVDHPVFAGVEVPEPIEPADTPSPEVPHGV